ncbi:ABC transporter ATP-binding protein [Nitriliruptor alkaliphilus]|uniref:ABC transporter ATP-binding protein n=1 Tax=Nitriliruptor alkaliphilus TaxID=427918 RepID=UPI001470276A|nr:ABC transporter ATP-binding protein [Nitriliruptor alkaliphilus]
MSLEVQVQRTIDDFHLDVDLRSDALITVLIGPSGGGKTSTLRSIAGLDTGGRQRIVVAGRTIADSGSGRQLPPQERRLGMVTQSSTLLPHRSVLRNVALAVRDGDRGGRTADARTWLARVGADAWSDRRPSALSGGQQQRVSLARALAGRPHLLLLDEPFSAVDAPSRAALRGLLRRLAQETSTPVLLVTHDPTEALTLADHLAVIEDGRITQQGPPADVTARPRSRWVAELVGLNLLRGTAVGTLVRLDGGGELRTADAAQGPVAVTIHPRAVSVHRVRPGGSPRNVLTGEIVDLDARGDHVRVRVDGLVPLVAEVTPQSVAALDLGVGGAVHLAVKATEIAVHADVP